MLGSCTCYHPMFLALTTLTWHAIEVGLLDDGESSWSWLSTSMANKLCLGMSDHDLQSAPQPEVASQGLAPEKIRRGMKSVFVGRKAIVDAMFNSHTSIHYPPRRLFSLLVNV